jgi:hypothetical protein
MEKIRLNLKKFCKFKKIGIYVIQKAYNFYILIILEVLPKNLPFLMTKRPTLKSRKK